MDIAMSATLLLDPNYINLHALLHRYFAESHAVFAEFLALPDRQAKEMSKDGVDIVLLSLISQALAVSPIPSSPTTPPKVAFTSEQLAAYPSLPLGQVLGQNLEMAIHCLMARHTITKATAEKLLAPLATFCVHYIDRISHDGRLTAEQKRLWLGLQTRFLPKHTLTIAKSLGLVLVDIDVGSHAEFEQDKLQFDQKSYKLPNWRWLVTLALTLQREEPLVLTKGGVVDFAPQFDYALPPADKPAFDSTRYAWLGVGVLMVVVGGLLAVKIFSPAVPEPAPVVQQVQKPVIKDVAIVRVDDKDGNKDAKTGDKGDKKGADKGTDNKVVDKAGKVDKKDSADKADKTVAKTNTPTDTPNKPATTKPKEPTTAQDNPNTGKTSTGTKGQYTLALPTEDASDYTLGDYLKKSD